MSKELDNIFVDVRNAFRLLNRYQKRILHIVTYIREQTPFNDMWGKKNWYSDEIGKRKGKNNNGDTEYANLSVRKDMWGWDFLYGYFFEYYFGEEEIAEKNVAMSVFQVSDDGYFISHQEKKHMTQVDSFNPAEKSHSYLIFNVSVFKTKHTELWLKDSACPDDDWKDFLTKFLSSEVDLKVTRNNKGEITILKKYEMQRFSTQQEADAVIRDFARVVKENAEVLLFKQAYYNNDYYI